MSARGSRILLSMKRCLKLRGGCCPIRNRMIIKKKLKKHKKGMLNGKKSAEKGYRKLLVQIAEQLDHWEINVEMTIMRTQSRKRRFSDSLFVTNSDFFSLLVQSYENDTRWECAGGEAEGRRIFWRVHDHRQMDTIVNVDVHSQDDMSDTLRMCRGETPLVTTVIGKTPLVELDGDNCFYIGNPVSYGPGLAVCYSTEVAEQLEELARAMWKENWLMHATLPRQEGDLYLEESQVFDRVLQEVLAIPQWLRSVSLVLCVSFSNSPSEGDRNATQLINFVHGIHSTPMFYCGFKMHQNPDKDVLDTLADLLYEYDIDIRDKVITVSVGCTEILIPVKISLLQLRELERLAMEGVFGVGIREVFVVGGLQEVAQRNDLGHLMTNQPKFQICSSTSSARDALHDLHAAVSVVENMKGCNKLATSSVVMASVAAGVDKGCGFAVGSDDRVKYLVDGDSLCKERLVIIFISTPPSPRRLDEIASMYGLTEKMKLQLSQLLSLIYSVKEERLHILLHFATEECFIIPTPEERRAAWKWIENYGMDEVRKRYASARSMSFNNQWSKWLHWCEEHEKFC